MELLRVHATLDGRGRAFDGERPVAEVEYSLKDVEEMPRSYTQGADATQSARVVAVRRTVYGFVKSPQAHALGEYVGARLVLQLDDGRLLPFTVAKVLEMNMLLIQGLGDVR